MMINVADVVACPEFAQIIDVISNTGATRDSYGIPTVGTDTTTQVEGTVLKATPKELRQLGQGELAQEVIKFLTETEIKLSKVDAQSDRLVWHGKKYKVIRVDDNSDFGFYRAFAQFEEIV